MIQLQHCKWRGERLLEKSSSNPRERAHAFEAVFDYLIQGKKGRRTSIHANIYEV